MNELHQPREESPAQQDNFQKIKGIGQSISQILIELGIHTFEELAEFTPDGLATLLKDRIPSISQQQIKNKDWIGQARSLALAKQGATSTESRALEQTRDQQTDGEKDAVMAPRESWRELADFFVSFGYAAGPDGVEQLQTKVHHSQADRLEIWDGISTQHLMEWMLTQANLPVHPKIEDVSLSGFIEGSSEGKEPAQEAQLEIADLWVTETQGSFIPGETESSTALQIEARLILSGPAAIDLASDSIPFIIDFHLVKSDNNRSNLVATYNNTLSPGQMVYEVTETFGIPPVGRYQLFVVARLSPPGTLVTHLQGPTIRVEPRSQKNISSLRGRSTSK